MGSDVVLVHGTTQTAAGYRRLADALSARGHRPWTVDVPGGLGGATEYAERLAAGLPDLHRPVVVAHSGAGVLLPALATHRRAVRPLGGLRRTAARRSRRPTLDLRPARR